MYIPRLRKKTSVMKEIRAMDPNTALIFYLIDRLIQTGQITAIKYGNAEIINLDELFGYFHKRIK